MLCYHQIYPHSLQNINQGFISSPFSFASFYTNHLQIGKCHFFCILLLHNDSPLHIPVISSQQSDLFLMLLLILIPSSLFSQSLLETGLLPMTLFSLK